LCGGRGFSVVLQMMLMMLLDRHPVRIAGATLPLILALVNAESF
jgi:hypothetical protein